MGKVTVEVKRKFFFEKSTISECEFQGFKFFICEDKDRDLTKDMPLEEIEKIKVYGETAIPYGMYELKITYSPRFKCMMPEILGVPGWSGVRIHTGNTHLDSLGCPLVGMEHSNGTVLRSRVAYNTLFPMLEKQQKMGKMFIHITKFEEIKYQKSVL
jgi:hypothetical protein